MAIYPAPNSELGRDRRVRIDPIKIAEYKMDLGEAFDGIYSKEGRATAVSIVEPGRKTSDRMFQVKQISNAHLLRVPDLADGGYSVFLVGTGIGGQDDPQFTASLGMSDRQKLTAPERIETQLKKIGVKLEEIDYVIIPSLDFLNSGNLVHQNLRGDRVPLGPSAVYLVHALDHKAMMAARPSTAAVFRGVRRDFDLVRSKSPHGFHVWQGHEVGIGEFVTIVHHGGVTPGYCSVRVRVGSETVLISSLFFQTPVHLDPDVQWAKSFSRIETFEAKEALLNEARKNQYIILCTSDPALTAGYVRKQSGVWVMDKVGDILH